MFLVKTCDKQCSNENKILNNCESHIMKEQKREAQLLLRLQCKMLSYSKSDRLEKQPFLFKIVPKKLWYQMQRQRREKTKESLYSV